LPNPCRSTFRALAKEFLLREFPVKTVKFQTKTATDYFFDTLKTRLELDYFCNTTISRYRAVARSENP
jgi:hypothetical protein